MEAIDAEYAEVILLPHFRAIQDIFGEHELCGDAVDVSAVRMNVLDGIQEGRHYAACKENGKEIILATEMVHLPIDNVLAIICHEFGHACDFLYPGMWYRNREPTSKELRLWSSRTPHQMELDADEIVRVVTGKRILYDDWMLQSFARGVYPRPFKLDAK